MVGMFCGEGSSESNRKKEASTTPPLHNRQEWGTRRENRRQNPKGCPTRLLLVLKFQVNLESLPSYQSRTTSHAACASMLASCHRNPSSRVSGSPWWYYSPSISSISTTATSPARSSSPCARSSTSTTARSASSAAPSSGSTPLSACPSGASRILPAAKSSWHGESSYGPP